MTPGQQVWVYARLQTDRTVRCDVAWYNSSGTLLSTTAAGTSTAEDRYRSHDFYATAPASAATFGVTLVQTNWSSTAHTMNLYALFAAPTGSDVDTAGYDPSEWTYFDGSSGYDYRGTQTRWDGAVDASTSSTSPLSVENWQAGPAVALLEPGYRPPGSTGKVLALPGFANAVAATPVTTSGSYGSYAAFRTSD